MCTVIRDLFFVLVTDLCGSDHSSSFKFVVHSDLKNGVKYCVVGMTMAFSGYEVCDIMVLHELKDAFDWSSANRV